MRQHFFAGLVMGCLGCSSHAPIPMPSTAEGDAPVRTQCDQLEVARVRHADILLHGAPRYRGDGSTPSTIQFISKDLGTWLGATHAQVRDVEQIYLQGVATCEDEGQKNLARLYGGRLWKWLGHQAFDAGREAVPRSMRGDAEAEKAVLGALTDSLEPAWDAARRLLEECASSKGDSPTVAECRLELSGLPKFTPRMTALKGSDRACEQLAIERTTSNGQCTFAGTIWAELEFFSSEQGGAAVMTSSRTTPVNVVQLEVPSAPDGRFRITTSRPVKFSGWATSRSGAFALKEQLAIVQDHIWLMPDTPLHAIKKLSGVQVSAHFGAGAEVKPKNWAKNVGCNAITLLGPKSEELPPGELEMLSQRSVVLFDSAGGTGIGAVEGDGGTTVAVQERRPGWSRVRGTTPFTFDGWVRETDISTEKPLGVAILMPQCSHVAKTSVPLLLEGRSDGLVVAELPTQGQFRVDSNLSSTEFAAVAISGVRSTVNKFGLFFVKRSLLDKASAPLE